MDRNAGLWIDHKQAYLIWYKEGRVEVIPSNVEPPAHFSGGTQLGGKLNQKGDIELRHNARYELQLLKFYRQVIAALKDVNSVFVMGPGKAKVEFEKAIKKHKSMQQRLLKVETADKMTKNQMIARVRKFYKSMATA
jgi:stalled ribosome rescue protein Dom34